MNFSIRLIIILLATTCLTTIFSLSKAQSDSGLGNWNAVILKGRISPKISSISEAHLRSNHYDLKYDYIEVKTGIAYSFTKKFFAVISTGIFNVYQTGGLFQTPARQKEFRTWLELNYKHVLNRINIEHRGRIEQRFIPNNYKNRLRYRLGIIIPVNKAELVQGSLYLALNDELFIPQHGPAVEKNRYYMGAGYKINGNTALQIGCVTDTDYKSNSHTAISYAQLMLIYDFTKLFKKQP